MSGRLHCKRSFRSLFWKRSICLFAALLSLCVALAACKRNPQLVAPAKATPAPPAMCCLGTCQLKSQVIVLCYHLFMVRPESTASLSSPPISKPKCRRSKISGIVVILMGLTSRPGGAGERGNSRKKLPVIIRDFDEWQTLSGVGNAWHGRSFKKFGYPFTMFSFHGLHKGWTEVRRTIHGVGINSPSCATRPCLLISGGHN